MDLVTLVTLCSVAFDAGLMHALVIVESEAKPWSFRDREGGLRSFATPAEAAAHARHAQADSASLGVGLTGLPTDLLGVAAQPNEAMFEPCPNVALASFRLERRLRTCRNRHPMELAGRCALPTYRGRFETPDWAYADHILVTSARGNLWNPVIDMDCKCEPEPTTPARGRSHQDPRSRTILCR